MPLQRQISRHFKTERRSTTNYMYDQEIKIYVCKKEIENCSKKRKCRFIPVSHFFTIFLPQTFTESRFSFVYNISAADIY